jgi:hypothetical protein
MIYMVEMDLIDRDRRVAWDAWYLAHTKMLLTMPGFHATQRFECLHEAPAPFVAIHHVDGPDFFESDPYRNQAGPAGTGEWRTRHVNWSRNLFNGIDATPTVPLEGGLLVVEEGGEVGVPDGLSVTWLNSIGLDKDVARRGFAVADDIELARLAVGEPGIRVLKPLIPRLTKANL